MGTKTPFRARYGIEPRTVTLTSSSNATSINCETTDIGIITLTENTTFSITGTPYDGQLILIRIKSASSYTIAFSSDIEAGSSLVLPSATTGSNKIDAIALRRSSTQSKWIFDASTIGTIPTAADNSIEPIKLTRPYVQGSPVTLSGVSYDFTGIPSWVTKICVKIAALSTNGTSVPIIQLGDSGGIEPSGYLGTASVVDVSAAVAAAAFTTGLGLVHAFSATTIVAGVATIELVDASTNTWVMKFEGALTSQTTTVTSASTKSLSAALTQLRLTTVGGSNTIDGGVASISWQ